MKPEPSPSRVSIWTTAGLTAAATAAMGSSAFGSTVLVEPLLTATAAAPASVIEPWFVSVERAKAKPPPSNAALTATAATTRHPRRGREVPIDGGGNGGGGGGGAGGGGTIDVGAVIGAHEGASLTGGSGAAHVGGRKFSQSTSLKGASFGSFDDSRSSQRG